MHRVHSFPPVTSPLAHTLLLGSMPGTASLAAAEYYAHPRNLFWPFIEQLFDIPRDAPYPERIQQLTERGIAVWDVLSSCERAGSLDAAIQPGSLATNDLAGFINAHPALRRIFFNGATAETLFRRFALHALPEGHGLCFVRLPSTSPANASMSREHKLMQWREIVR